MCTSQPSNIASEDPLHTATVLPSPVDEPTKQHEESYPTEIKRNVSIIKGNIMHARNVVTCTP